MIRCKLLSLWALAVFIFSVCATYFPYGKRIDFDLYWASFQMLTFHLNPYDLHALTVFTGGAEWSSPAFAPPWIYALMAPVLWPPIAVSAYLWVVINVGLLFGVFKMTWSWLSKKQCPWETLFLLGVFYAPIAFNFYLGQFGLITTFGLLGCLLSLENRKDVLAGGYLILGTLKPHTIYLIFFCLLLWALQNKRYRFLIAFLSFQIGLIAIAAMVFPNIFENWLNMAMAHTTQHTTSTLPSILRYGLYYGKEWKGVSWPLWSIPGCVMFFTWRYFRRRPIHWRAHLPFLLSLSLLTSPYAYSFDFSVLIIVLIMMVEAVWSNAYMSRLEKGIVFFRIAALYAVSWGVFILVQPDKSGYVWLPALVFFIWFRTQSSMRFLPSRVE